VVVVVVDGYELKREFLNILIDSVSQRRMPWENDHLDWHGKSAKLFRLFISSLYFCIRPYVRGSCLEVSRYEYLVVRLRLQRTLHDYNSDLSSLSAQFHLRVTFKDSHMCSKVDTHTGEFYNISHKRLV
jgi:hypothetical protein